MNNLWQQLETKKISRQEIEQYLTQKLGQPTNELQNNLLFELTKKIVSYYSEEPQQSQTTYSLLGTVAEIVEKKFKEGKRRGQIFYSVQLKEGQKLRVLKEDLPKEKWTQVEQLAILNKNLVFKYKIWLLNKDIIDFYPPWKIKKIGTTKWKTLKGRPTKCSSQKTGTRHEGSKTLAGWMTVRHL